MAVFHTDVRAVVFNARANARFGEEEDEPW